MGSASVGHAESGPARSLPAEPGRSGGRAAPPLAAPGRLSRTSGRRPSRGVDGAAGASGAVDRVGRPCT